MGIEDREYLRDEEGYDAYSNYGRRSGPVSIVTKIIIVTVGVFLLQLLFPYADGRSVATECCS